MTDREHDHRLDAFAMRYLAAVDAEDFTAVGDMWEQAETDPELAAMLHELNVEIAAASGNVIEPRVIATFEKLLPSATIERPASNPVTVAEVAEQLRRHPPAGLAMDDLRITDVLKASTETVPAALGLPETVAWGRQFGSATEAYWKAFREAALLLRMQRESQAENWQMAARPAKRPEGKS
jgi:hypothetical protein